MNYLLVEELSKSYGEKLLFSSITFGLEKGQKAGLIARNGTGKTTLLEIIAGKGSADSGKVVIRRGIRMMYLPQEPVLNPDDPALEAVLASDTEQAKLISEYERLVAVPTEHWDNEQHRRFDAIGARLTELDAWHFESRVKEVLGKLDIHNYDQPCGQMSGGQRKKVALARVLIEDADLLILDEPTNHLDIDTIEWMEEFLNRSQLTLILVTHDRYFLDQVCDSIIEMDQGTLFQYKGDYSWYLEKKAEREAGDAVVMEKQKSLYKQELEWIRRMPKARTHKSKARIQEFGKIEDQVHQHTRSIKQEFFVKMDRLGSKILEINNIHKRFGDINLVEDFSYIFKKGDKVGLVGRNGSGKSTFLDILFGAVRADLGRVVRGQTLKMAYFTQQGIPLDESRRVIDIVKDVAEEVYVDDKHSISASRFLSMFGISHDIQYNYAQYLSGGERRKLHLLLTLMQQPNFLMLDEPTNDLDIQTLQALEEFLVQYKGCLVVASHDRFFLDKIAGHLFVFKGEGQMKDFYGNYTMYREERNKEQQKAKLQSRLTATVAAREPKKTDPSKATWKEMREFETLELEIAALDLRKTALEQQLNSGETDHLKLQEWADGLSEVMMLLEVKTDRWLELSEKCSG
jgi:ABC transport system ATP-binding/permease protein